MKNLLESLREEREELRKRHKIELDEIYARHKGEVRDYDIAISALDKSGPAPLHSAKPNITINEAIIKAIENGCVMPVPIHSFISNQLGVDTTLNSIRTRLSKLFKDEKIARDQHGYIPIRRIKAPDKLLLPPAAPPPIVPKPPEAPKITETDTTDQSKVSASQDDAGIPGFLRRT